MKNRWMQAVGGVLILLFAGIIYAWSVLASPIASEFTNWSKGSMGLTFTLAMSFFCMGILAAGLIGGKIKERYLLWVAAAFLLGGFLLVSNLNSLMMLYVGFGVCGGLGAGLAYNVVMGSVTRWFPDKGGLISGILLMGFGIGAFIIGKIYTAFLTAYGWRSEFRVMGIVVFAVIVFGSFIVRKPTEEERNVFLSKAVRGGKESKGEFLPGQMVKTTAFWFYFVWVVIMSAVALALIAQASGIVVECATDLGLGTIATIVGMISVCNGAGRVIFGGFYDKFGQKKTMLTNDILYVVSIGITMAGVTGKNLPLVIVGFIVFGLAYGGVTPTNSAFMLDFFGAKNYPVNFSLINLNLLVASYGGTLAGMVYDKTGSYQMLFIMMLVGVAVSTGCTLFIRRPQAG